MSNSDIHAALLENPAFAGFTISQQGLKDLEPFGFMPKRYAAHGTIAPLGDERHRVRIVQSGWCRIEKFVGDGERQIIDFPIRGDIIGLAGDNRMAGFSVTAVTDVIVFESRPGFAMERLDANSPLDRVLLNAAGRRLAIMCEHMINLGRRSVLGRTSHMMLELGVRVTGKKPREIKQYACPLTQNDLADAVGLTPIHLNRKLRELREDGLVSFRQGNVELLDVDRLIELADFDHRYLRV
ncbi:MAG: Crp/Fnr family transcriptional regulator [Aquamicrobium sp.]|nr:Crp/Fnr family transcriptional regulator [Aquamicrobium sp.]